jgi:transcriptional regulator of acetoin/glycerol metabolism
MESLSLMELLTEQILNRRISVDDARQIVLRREWYRSRNALQNALGKPLHTLRLDVIEGEAIRMALIESHWDISRAATVLGISRTTLYRRLKVTAPAVL